jgi:hypothetical protein
MGEWRQIPHILNLSTTAVSFTPHPSLPSEKQPSLAMVEEGGWASQPVWMLWRRERSLAPVGKRTQGFGYQACSPVTKPTGLFWLRKYKYNTIKHMHKQVLKQEQKQVHAL